MTDPTDRFCLRAIFVIEALKALEDGCPEDETEFAGEINLSIGLRQILEIAVDSYEFPDKKKLRHEAAKLCVEKFLAAFPAPAVPYSSKAGDELHGN